MLLDTLEPPALRPALRNHAAAPRRTLLLLEPFAMLRSTVIGVAKDFGMAQIQEAVSFEAAAQQMSHRRFDGCVLSIGDERREVELIRRLRAGLTECWPTTPVAVMTAECDAAMVLVLRELQISRILLKPFKVKAILETINQLFESTPLPK
ncbi:MAG: hypothetical protein JWP52_3557 [Rhizobacter sp.]|jgi:DNA-binding NarL/FixJ family response regulator|nr:hypothetical protein [Rhizobacter sp.]